MAGTRQGPGHQGPCPAGPEGGEQGRSGGGSQGWARPRGGWARPSRGGRVAVGLGSELAAQQAGTRQAHRQAGPCHDGSCSCGGAGRAAFLLNSSPRGRGLALAGASLRHCLCAPCPWATQGRGCPGLCWLGGGPERQQPSFPTQGLWLLPSSHPSPAPPHRTGPAFPLRSCDTC